jgi:hypothetical protein
LTFLLEVSNLLFEMLGDSCQGAADDVVDKANWKGTSTVAVAVAVAVVVVIGDAVTGLTAAAVVHDHLMVDGGRNQGGLRVESVRLGLDQLRRWGDIRRD